VLRGQVEGILADHRRAEARWVAMVGPDVDVEVARTHEEEIRAYHEALQSLGGAADGLEQLPRELADAAEPTLAQAGEAVADACAPYGLVSGDLADPTLVVGRVAHQVAAGRLARQHHQLAQARQVRAEADAAPDAGRLRLGFGSGGLPARLGALQWVLPAHLTEAAPAGPNDDPVPVLLDEVFLRVPAERKWDLLDPALLEASAEPVT
jgi:hypothetical protein